MSSAASFETFEKELARLVASFGSRLTELKQPGYAEAQLRADFLDPFFAALGWDLANRAGLIQKHREVEIESRTEIAGRKKRADYLFRTDTHDRFVCEAKKPAEDLVAKYAFQAKRYSWNKGLALAVLSDFEEIKIYIVGGRPRLDEPLVGLWKTWHFQQFPAAARELWDLLSRPQVAGGSISRLLEFLPKKPAGKGRAKEQWILKPDRSRALDVDFLALLDESRRALAADLLRHNDRADLLAGNQLNDAVQRILDRLLFLRICEDRDIDTGLRLDSILGLWRKQHADSAPDELREEPPAWHGASGVQAPRGTLWHKLVCHLRALDRRPPTHAPFFNGTLFKPHFSEELVVGDDWLATFLARLGDEDSPYLFAVMPVEILGSVYERFLGKVVRPHGRGVTIEEKPEVRKAGGVYYTPRYIVNYIVEQTVGKLLAEIAGRALSLARHEPSLSSAQAEQCSALRPSLKDFERRTAALRLLDPACGSGSFLIRAFERVCEHWQQRLTGDLPPQEQTAERAAWETKHRPLCWVNDKTGDIHLTIALKRRILTQNIYGVDLDAAAVEVTQLSLYLKLLEDENRTTLARERELIAEAVALLPELKDNIKRGNSLIASDFSMLPADLVRVHAFDWPVQFAAIMKAGGFDAVIGNPPYIRIQTMQESDPESVEYLNGHYAAAAKGNYDIYVVFVERVLSLLKPNGKLGYILPHKFFNAQYGEALRGHLTQGKHLHGIVHFGDQQIFEGATTYTCLLFLSKTGSDKFWVTKVTDLAAWQADGSGAQGTRKAKELGAEAWNFHVGPDAELFAKLSGYPTTLGHIASRMAQGIRTSANEVYVLAVTHNGPKIVSAQSEVLGREVKVERRSVARFLQGRDIKRYCLLDSGKVVIIPYRQTAAGPELISEKEMKESQPNTFDYLRENKACLESRERGRMRGQGWYGYVYPKNLELMQCPKILVPDIADGTSYALDETGEFAFTSGYAITLQPEIRVSPKFVLGLLNSQLLDFFLKKVSTTMRGGFFRYFTQFIEKLPIVLPDLSQSADKSRHDKLVLLVDKLLALMPKLRAAKYDSEKAVLQNAVTATDQQIDALVYELYGLTADEIALVEGTGK